MKKKLLSLSVVAATVITGVLTFTGCGLIEDNKYYSVTNADELKAMQENRNYKLKQDIDLSGDEWLPLNVKNFDGNGYSIKNCTITTAIESYRGNYTGFFGTAKDLKNITFENLEINVTLSKSSNNTNYCGLAGGILNSLENVSVINSTAKFIVNNDNFVYSGGIGGAVTTAKNCLLENAEIETVTSSSFVYVGGVCGILGFGLGFGGAPDLQSCRVINSTISTDNAIALGGVIGYISESGNTPYSITDSYISKSRIKMTASTKAVAYGGGIIGLCEHYEMEISNCASLNNQTEITSKSGYIGYSMGGIAGNSYGRISQCISI